MFQSHCSLRVLNAGGKSARNQKHVKGPHPSTGTLSLKFGSYTKITLVPLRFLNCHGTLSPMNAWVQCKMAKVAEIER